MDDEDTDKIKQEQERIICLLNDAATLLHSNLAALDLLTAIKACVHNSELKIYEAYAIEREVATKRRGY